MRSLPKLAHWALILGCVAPLASCTFLDSFVPKKGESTDVIDRQKNLTVNDFRNITEIDKQKDKNTDPTVTAELGAPPIPDVAQVLATPRPPKVANTKLVTLAVTDDVPLRDVLFELGRLAAVDIEVGPGLETTGVNLRATNRPFNEVIERIAVLGHLRYSTTGNSIRVEKDTPYIKNYSLDFLNLVRSSTSGYNLSTNILASGGSSGSSSSSSSSSSSGGSSSSGTVGTSGSSATINTTAESDLWSSLEASVNEILNYNVGGADTVKATTPAVAPDAAAGAGSKSSIVINRQAGVLSVSATERQHEMVQTFLNMMNRNASAQVLIEAKIVEVSLADKFLSGVNWTHLLGNSGGISASIGKYNNTGTVTDATLGTGLTKGTLGNAALSLSVDAGDLDAIVAATQQFGTTRTLSSPRLSAINNQQAILTFARNEVFFKCETNDSSNTVTNGTTTTIDAKPKCTASSVPIGVILNIIPAVNLDSEQVTLNVRPTLTRIVGTVADPAGAVNGYISVYPVVEVRELDSVMKVKSGGVMIIGGLMEDGTRNTSDGVPGANEIPILGNLFKSRAEDSFKRELVIFIKATIVNPDGSTHESDRKLYDKFFSDPRPLYK